MKTSPSRIKFLLLIFTIIQSTTAPFSLDLSINRLKYSVCTVYVDASAIPMYRTIDHEVFKKVIVENQQRLDLLWVIVKTTILVTTNDGKLLANTGSNYIADRVKYSTKSCNVILTDLSEITSPPFLMHRHERFYFDNWSSWLYRVAGGRNFPLNRKPTFLFALTYNHYWGIRDYTRDQALASPVLTFILEFKALGNFELISCKWVCIHCFIDKEIFHIENPFTAELTKFLLAGYPEPTFLEIFQKRPQYVTELWPAQDSRIDKVFCLFPTKELAKNICNQAVRANLLSECLQPNAIIISEMSRILNFTMIFGGAIPPGGDVYHFKGLILQVTAGKTWKLEHSHNLMDSGKGTDETIMEDKAFWRCGYCERKMKFSPHDIFKILGGSFDKYTWLAICASVLAVFIYSKLVFFGKKFNKTTEIVLEIFSMLLQQGIIHFQGYKMAVVFASFLLAFFYTDDMTGKMIAPPSTQLKETLTELLNGGLKIVKHPNDQFDLTRIQFADKLYLHLRRENFEGDIFSMKYWQNFTAEAVYSPGTISQEIVTSIFQPLGAFTKYRTMENCDVLKKQYEVGSSYIRAFAINRRQISRVLKGLYFESGVRIFWTQIINQADIRAANNNDGKKLKERVVALVVDDRVVSVILVWVGLLAFSCAIFVIEVDKLFTTIHQLWMKPHRVADSLQKYVAFLFKANSSSHLIDVDQRRFVTKEEKQYLLDQQLITIPKSKRKHYICDECLKTLRTLVEPPR
ncbi:unnamed protein product [Orchesella dallaii]|uniref:Uncharacterized protein n=1 Tax=Orchesella dallaii TaxID=48710 RepID=A0ABP1QV38_9HEXA